MNPKNTERYIIAYKMRVDGQLYKAIGYELGVSTSRARDMVMSEQQRLDKEKHGQELQTRLARMRADAAAGHDFTIDELPWTMRTWHVLQRHGITTVQRLVSTSAQSLYHLPGMGIESLDEIKTVLEPIGLYLRW